MRINYPLIILCTSVSYICFNTSTVWTGCNSSNPVRKSSSTSNHHCPGVPSLWPWQGVPPGLDGLDRGAQPHRHLGHLWLLGLVPILLTAAGGPLFYLGNATVSINVFLHLSSLRKLLQQAKLAKYKMNPQYPSFNQIKHDALVGKSRSLMSNNLRQTDAVSSHSKNQTGRYIVLR